ncbi:MAG: polysaccharide deacetylase family protein [Candidatus Omnitrophica bacterium]|nr:polysaccharide deacetylase family protein [Candidatus Omnitrophota bacterium]
MSNRVVRIASFSIACWCSFQASGQSLVPIPDKTVVLTFDDSVKNHRTFVAPLLQKYGFGATFYVTHAWMKDTEHFMNWEEIQQLEAMGFEIGNHTWSHDLFHKPEAASRLPRDLERIDEALEKVGVPKPITFAWPANRFGPESREVLRKHGILFGRRGMQPEFDYQDLGPGNLYDPKVHDPLLIPTAGDVYPNWTVDHFQRVVDRAKDEKIAVLMFHGVPDVVHPWVTLDPDKFRDFMAYLFEEHFNVIAMRDLQRYVDPTSFPEDPMAKARYNDVPLDR